MCKFMNIRPSLAYQCPSPDLVHRMLDLLGGIEEAAYSNSPNAVLLEEFNSRSNQQFSLEELLFSIDSASGSVGLEEFVRSLLYPKPTRLEDMSDAELEEIIRHLQQSLLEPHSEAAYWLEVLDRHLPAPLGIIVSALDEDGSPAEILHQLKSYKPIAL